MIQDDGDYLEARHEAAFVVLPYVVSFIGCVTTLELIHWRTSRHGALNWYLLTTSSATFGGIGIWCMHFIRNRAIVITEGQPDKQILYNTSFTSVSFFLPIIVSLGAFYLLSSKDRVNGCYLASAGALIGAAINGMHYVGQIGISNCDCSYFVPNVVGAAIISVAGSLLVLNVFSRIREAWTDSWWKRALCGLVLACPISGTHRSAVLGTRYAFKALGSTPTEPLSRKQTLIECITSSCVTCILLLLVALFAGYWKKSCRSRAQQLILACGYFDEAGRILVTTKGNLPIQKIAIHYNDDTSTEQEFSRTHPAFTWAFRASYNWGSLKHLIPGIRDHLDAASNGLVDHHGEWGSAVYTRTSCLDSLIFFKESFILAAADLAGQIHQPLEALGTLLEAPIEMGREPRKLRRANRRKSKLASSGAELEKSVLPHFVSARTFLFIIRQVENTDIAQLSAAGFKFAPVTEVSSTLSKAMQLPTDALRTRLGDMQAQAVEKVMPSGVHLACFMLRPRLRQGFDILVPAKKRTQLPTVKLPHNELTPLQVESLEKLNDWTVARILERLENIPSHGPEEEVDFYRDFLGALTLLLGQIDDPLLLQAKFSARILEAPCRPQSQVKTPSEQALLISIHTISTIHSAIPGPDFVFIPLRSFTVQQQVYTGVADRDLFARQAYLEFAYCAETRSAEDGRISGPSSPVAISPSRYFQSLAGFQRQKNDQQRSSKDSRRLGSTAEKLSNSSSGAIAVSNHVSVDISEAVRPPVSDEKEQGEMGTTSCASVVAVETPTYVDELVALCKAE